LESFTTRHPAPQTRLVLIWRWRELRERLSIALRSPRWALKLTISNLRRRRPPFIGFHHLPLGRAPFFDERLNWRARQRRVKSERVTFSKRFYYASGRILRLNCFEH
jgi:hypothetical protein